VAAAVGGEVVNADASQLYRGMDIGTAKLLPAARLGVRHHLIDVLDAHEDASVADYQQQARSVIAAIAARGRLPVLVGGSGLYVSAVLDPLDFPGTDAGLRARLEAELAADGPAALHARLATRDPAAAAAILPTNGRRIVRALEVGELTGAPFPAALPVAPSRPPGVAVLALDADAAVLDATIAERVEAMWAAGLVAEVARLAPRLRAGRTARTALGYSQVLRLLDGEIDDATARADTTRSTRRFARRQRAWFRRETSAVRVRSGLRPPTVLDGVSARRRVTAGGCGSDPDGATDLEPGTDLQRGTDPHAVLVADVDRVTDIAIELAAAALRCAGPDRLRARTA